METFKDNVYLVSIKTEQVSIMRDLDPILNVNEAIAMYDGNTFIGHKVGDGKTKWSELQFVERISDIKECWLYVPDSNNPGEVRVAGKILLEPGAHGLDGLND